MHMKYYETQNCQKCFFVMQSFLQFKHTEGWVWEQEIGYGKINSDILTRRNSSPGQYKIRIYTYIIIS